jgi:D-alanyl-D-alanine carboxypeptidase
VIEGAVQRRPASRRSARAGRRSASNAEGVLRAATALAVTLALVACGPVAAPSTTVYPSATVVPTGTALPTGTPPPRLGAFPRLPTTELPIDAAASLQAIVDGAVDTLDAPGVAAAVIVADRGTWAGAAGTADGTAPLDQTAQFAIGSVTKTITATQVLQLVESGTIDLDRPIAEYLGDNDLATNGATVRQVLGMRSGIGDPQVSPTTCLSDLAASISLANLRTVPLGPPYFEPGTAFRYTSSNYDFAAIMIEEVTGSTLGSVLRSGVLSAPGLQRLIYQDAERPTPPLAAPFVVGSGSVPGPIELLEVGGGYQPARCLASSAGPAGGMASDAITLARWGYLLYGGWVLGDEALAQMADHEDGYYGLAAIDYGSVFGGPALGHGGTVPGYTAQLLAFPGEGLAVAVLMNTNGDEDDLASVAGQLRAALAP